MLHPTKNILLIGTSMTMLMMSRCAAFVLPRIRPTATKAFVTSAASYQSLVQIERQGPAPFSATTTAARTTRLFSASSTAESASTVLKRVKTINAVEPTEDPVIIKGWVKTIRKQKTLAFVQVNDGSNMKGIQCVISLDDIDEQTKQGKLSWQVFPLICICCSVLLYMFHLVSSWYYLICYCWIFLLSRIGQSYNWMCGLLGGSIGVFPFQEW
jgi:hypothetical protein